MLRNDARAAVVTVDVSQTSHAAHISTLLMPSGALCVVSFFLRGPNDLSFSHWCFSRNKQHTNKATKTWQKTSKKSAILFGDETSRRRRSVSLLLLVARDKAYWFAHWFGVGFFPHQRHALRVQTIKTVLSSPRTRSPRRHHPTL